MVVIDQEERKLLKRSESSRIKMPWNKQHDWSKIRRPPSSFNMLFNPEPLSLHSGCHSMATQPHFVSFCGTVSKTDYCIRTLSWDVSDSPLLSLNLTESSDVTRAVCHLRECVRVCVSRHRDYTITSGTVSISTPFPSLPSSANETHTIEPCPPHLLTSQPLTDPDYPLKYQA